MAPMPPGGATRRQGSPHRENWADLWSAQPAEGGRREGPPVPRWFLLGGNPSGRRDPYIGMADTVRNAAAPCLRPVKADGNEPPAALRAAVPAPTGRTGQRSAQFSRWGLPDRRRHLAWWRTCETCSLTATGWRSVSPIPHPVTPVSVRASRGTVTPLNRCGSLGCASGREYEKYGLLGRFRGPPPVGVGRAVVDEPLPEESPVAGGLRSDLVEKRPELEMELPEVVEGHAREVVVLQVVSRPQERHVPEP